MPIELETINTGASPNDGTGDTARVAWGKQNRNNGALAAAAADIAAAAAAAVAASQAAAAAAAAAQSATADFPELLAQKAGRARRAIADASAQIVVGDVYVALTALTAPRTLTLPPAAAYPVGQTLYVADESGACAPSRAITLTAAGTDTIAGQATHALTQDYAKRALHSNGLNLWTVA